AACDHFGVRLRDHAASRIRDSLHAFLGHHAALPAGYHLAVLFRDGSAGCVRNLLDAFGWHHDASLAGDHLGMVFRDHPAGHVAHLPCGAHRHHFAHIVIHDVAVFLGHHLAAAHRADLLARHPDLLALPPAGNLHGTASHRAGAVS